MKKSSESRFVLTNNSGITLIALVITIIVMLILVAVTISIAVNGGLFDYAGNAVKETEKEKQKELELANLAPGMSTDELIAKFTEAGGNGFCTKNEEYVDKNGAKAIIPKGFKLLDIEDEVSKGIVIEDDKGNQFVWIPVNYTATGTTDGNGLDAGFKVLFYRSDWNNNARTGILGEPYKEDASIDPTGKYNEMMLSVQEHKGFYIGRYEAGSITERTSSSDATTKAVVQKGAYPYNYVSWEDDNTNSLKGAVTLCSEMYTDSNKYGVTSTLCYGVQWDEMLDFIKDTNNVSNSSTWGNYKDHTFTFTGKYAVLDETDYINFILEAFTANEATTNKPESKSWLLTTGACETNKAKNIYDVAGNLYEWTMEAYTSDSSDHRVYRGSLFSLRGSNYPASYRDHVNPGSNNWANRFSPCTLYKR